MTEDEMIEALAVCDEVEDLVSELPHDSIVRLAFLGTSKKVRDEYKLKEAVKIKILLRRLEQRQPIAKSEFAGYLDFSRSECNRLIDSVIAASMVEVFQEATTNGRPRTMLQLPSAGFSTGKN